MPLEPNQQPCAGQRKVISTQREASNIPKRGTDSTWLYPSPQMFYNGADTSQQHSTLPTSVSDGLESCDITLQP